MKILSLLLVLILAGCSLGPDPTDQDYAKAIAKVPDARAAKYMASASYHPNVIMGNLISFNSVGIPGRLFVLTDKIIFAAYDDPSNTFLPTYEIGYSEIEWITWQQHGVNSIMRYGSDNTANSFLFSQSMDPAAQDIENSVIQQYIIDRHKFGKSK